jgi:hypothetical protein
MQPGNSGVEFSIYEMPSGPRLTHFVVEDSQVHLGQLVDTTRDIGLNSTNGISVATKVIEGTIFQGLISALDEAMHP